MQRLCLCLFALCFAWATPACAAEPLQLKTASTHPIQYYLSLPDGWSAAKKWPVLIVIESANRDFLEATNAFAAARKQRPFIIVTPLVLTNGGSGYRSVPTYHYSDQVWDSVQSSEAFKFDMDGITAIMQDVVKEYGGEDKYFIAGLEAAGHTIWGVLFNHPEAVRAATLVCPNYAGRWVDEAHISSAPERAALPIRSLIWDLFKLATRVAAKRIFLCRCADGSLEPLREPVSVRPGRGARAGSVGPREPAEPAL